MDTTDSRLSDDLRQADALLRLHQLEEAADCYERALHKTPALPAALNNLGVIRTLQAQLTTAAELFREILALRPNTASAHSNLGALLKDQGRLDESMTCFRNALRIDPLYWGCWDNLLMTMHYSCMSPEEITAEHAQWGLLRTAASSSPFTRVAAHNNVMRVGYVSADFRDHSVAYFMDSLLRGHDQDRVEVFAYAHVAHPDDTTARLQGHLRHDRWRSIAGLTDDDAAALIRSDHIDILVDCSGHTADNRLGVFALNPAPIQVTYLGYPGTTGLPAMHYRITDRMSEPSNADSLHTEELTYVEPGFLCLSTFLLTGANTVSRSPAATHGCVTFGSFNHLSKTTPDVVSLWARILNAVPRSRLLMKTKALADDETRSRYVRMFLDAGVDHDRIVLEGRSSTKGSHLSRYSEIDIALDPFPYNGTTTTCEALWMGVPVVALKGRAHVGMVSHGLLTRLGLRSWIADSQDDYVDIASRYALDINSLNDVRLGMRERIGKSGLCDHRGFCNNLEDVYQEWLNRLPR